MYNYACLFLKIPKNIDLTLNIILYMAHQNNKNTYCAKSSLKFEKKTKKKGKQLRCVKR